MRIKAKRLKNNSYLPFVTLYIQYILDYVAVHTCPVYIKINLKYTKNLILAQLILWFWYQKNKKKKNVKVHSFRETMFIMI